MSDTVREQIAFAVRRHWSDLDSDGVPVVDAVMTAIADIAAENERLTRLTADQAARLDSLTRDRHLLRQRV